MVLILIEIDNGQIKKTSLEAVYFGAQVAKSKGVEAKVLAIGAVSNDALAIAGKFGVSSVLHANDAKLTNQNAMAYASVLTQAIQSTGAKIVITPKSGLSDAIAARTAGSLQAGYVGNVTELPNFSSGFSVVRSIFTGKAFATVNLNAEINILGVKKNAVEPIETSNLASIETFSANLPDSLFAAKILATEKATGTVSLPEADMVVSGGRGMKGPENWQPLLDLAEALNAATACSKPVSDLDWRPHHEHVGQTGVKVAPNLYIACGISGAIQHLAGVNSSKVIVVINKDPEAPFFKAADYGIVGDVFDVLPKLTAAVKALN
jgi:electron transfer flavoprotein alpha subunit